ncbi:hypothetical protein BGZ83_009604 [Gryganskiella cystojenkinii]|nr:hypothetical protein BGZ83_009604 [Gryganskiella cystojenkinii]
MDLNHDSATERYSENLNQALTYFSSLAQSSSGWKRLSSASVASVRSPRTGSGPSGSPGNNSNNNNYGGGTGSSASSSPSLNRNGYRGGGGEDPMASLSGGSVPSSAASAAIESLLPTISVSKKSVPGKSAEIVRASIILPGLDEQTDLDDWRAVLECTGARKIWDRMVESSTVMQTLDDNTCITKTIFKTTWPASPRDALLIETTLLDHNAVLHIATSIKPSHDDPIFLRPSPPHVRAYLPLVAWHVQLVPADLDETMSFTSFNSLTASQNKPVMPRHSIRVSFYYQIDMRGWAVNSSVSMQSHVPSCIANMYRLLRRQGVPPHVSRHSPRIQLDLNEYDPGSGIYELRYDVIPPDSEDLRIERKTVSNTLKHFRLGGSPSDPAAEAIKEHPEKNIPQEIVLSDDDDVEDMDSDNINGTSQNGYVDVELDGERWGYGSDIVVHIFMNDIEDEEFVREHVECLKYMGRDRYILRMKHTEIGLNQGAINVKLRIERIQPQVDHHNLQPSPVQDTSSAALMTDPSGLVVSVNGHEKDILPLNRTSMQGSRRGTMSLQDQLELSQQIVQEVDNQSGGHWQSGSDGTGAPTETKSTSSPLLLMSTSMPTTIQSLGKSNQSIMSNGTSTMAPGNTNPSKVNNSYTYFNSLLLEPATSWKTVTTQRDVLISKLESQGHAPGIVKGEGVFEDYSIWDVKAALDCISSRKIWDKLFDEAQMLQHVTPSSILSYVRLKGFWPSSPKDMALLNTTFITKDAIHYFATSVDDTNLYPSIPPPVSPFVRSDVVVSGWYLEAIKPRSVKIIYIAQAAPTGWMVPGSALGAMTTEMPLCVAEIIKYLESYGSPPTLVSIRRGRALGIEYSHEKSSFRLEYTQDSNPIFSGHRALQQQEHQQQQLHAERYRRSTVDFSVGMSGSSNDLQPFSSPKLSPTDKLLAEIRLDARNWARNGDCEITIDPPPSKVTCTCVPHDGTGIRLRIEHSSGRAVPTGGKVLVMVRKSAGSGSGVVVNGLAIKMPSLDHLQAWHHAPLPSSALSLSVLANNESSHPLDESESKASVKSLTGPNSPHASVPGTPLKNGASAASSPLQHAQGAMDLLAKIMSDPDDAWSVVSDTKGGLRVTKRFMPADISDQVPLVRGEKVLEGFSLEEIATVIGNVGTRSKLDDLFESGEMTQSFGAGCATFHHVLRGYFPLPLPARDLYFVTATALVETTPRCPQIMIVSTSIPHQSSSSSGSESTDVFSAPSTAASSPSQTQSRPKAQLHLSAWILERIDPYSSSHPIPSTRVTFMTALDLGGSVPQRISGLVQTMFPKMITQVENYLQAQAAPPIVRIPEQMVIAETSDSKIGSVAEESGLQLPNLVPWMKPANRLTSWEYKLKDSFYQMMLVFDQFQLRPSRLDLALERRVFRAKKLRKLGQEKSVDDIDVEALIREDLTTSNDKDGKSTTQRTVLEVIVDLKQYPLGYNIMTSIKVDPEFLLQHKQQREMEQRSALAKSSSTVKLTGSVSTGALSSSGSNSNVNTLGSSTRFIGGFDSNGTSTLGLNDLVDSDNTPTVRVSSEAASSGAGIAAVLGSSTNIARALPSSTSLIRILPPPITVNVIDIPPAPSHSSSLSGGSKRRKHLIIITVPEAEASAAHAHAQHQATSSQGSKGTVAPHIISGTAAKPVVTTSSVVGTTSTMFAQDDKILQPRARTPVALSQDSESVFDASTTRPFSPPARSSTPDMSGTKSPLIEPAPILETRMFQFSVKIDRLEHKDRDHSAALQSKKDPLTLTSDEKEWTGKVMADGVTIKVQTKWSRRELGFLDGMMEEEEAKEEEQQRRGSRKNDPQQRSSGDMTDQEHGVNGDEAPSANETVQQEHEDLRRRKSVSRRKSHHRQQLANLNGHNELETPPESRSRPHESTAAEGLRALANAPAHSSTNQRPTSSMASLSNFLVNVGLLKSSTGSHEDMTTATSSPVPKQSPRHSSLPEDQEDQDDDRTIRASKSNSRGAISALLSTGSGKSRKHGGDDHDLDLESLHGSIVFKDDDDEDGHGGDGRASDEELVHESNHRQKSERGSAEWGRQSSSNGIRRRRDKKGQQSHGDLGLGSRPSLDEARSFANQEHNSDFGSNAAKMDSRLTRRRRKDSSASLSRYSRTTRRSSTTLVHRPGSTNGADHPRFKGSQLYAYSFRNLFWSAVACFVFGLLLRIYVIGPSFSKTASSGSSLSAGSTATYYYYYRAAAPLKTASTLTGSSATPLSYRQGTQRQLEQDQDRASQRGDNRPRRGREEEDPEGSSSTQPQGIQEVFTVRDLFGWDYVLLAYPTVSQESQS